MSGGRFDYFFGRMAEVAKQIYPATVYTKEEKEISKLMLDFSNVMYALEWWKSGDTDEKTFLVAYNKFKKKWLK